jgi:hypothetical protein
VARWTAARRSFQKRCTRQRLPSLLWVSRPSPPPPFLSLSACLSFVYYLDRSLHSFLFSAACFLIAAEGGLRSISRMGAGRYGSGSWQNPSALAKGWARGLRRSPCLSAASQPRAKNRPQVMGLIYGTQAWGRQTRNGRSDAPNTYLSFNDVCIYNISYEDERRSICFRFCFRYLSSKLCRVLTRRHLTTQYR